MPGIPLASTDPTTFSSAHGSLRPSRRTTRLIVAGLLGVLAALLIGSARQESQTFDEGDHLFAGFEYWKHGDFGRNPEHPPLVKLVATIPLLFMNLKEPWDGPITFFKAEDMNGGARLLYSGDADVILLRGRIAASLFSFVLAWLVFLAGREMFGTLAGLFGLGLFVFEPVLLANGVLVTTDMGLTCLYFAAVYTFYRYVKRSSLPRLAVFALIVGLTIVSKQSGVLILPVLAILALIEVFSAFDRHSLGGVNGWHRRLLEMGFALVAVLFVSYVVVWTIYGFRFAARPGQLQIDPVFPAFASGIHNAPLAAAILFFAHHHLLPEAYLYGWADILQILGNRTMFLWGRLFTDGRWFFFPTILFVKTTLTLLILLAMFPFAGIHGRRREILFLTVPPACFFLAALFSMLDMGIRHILPIYPFCFVLAGGAAGAFAVRSVGSRVAVGLLLLFTVISSLHSYPDFLAYSNEIAGGPSRTYRVVADSNSDWGQGLKWTKTYLDQHPASDCWIDYSIPVVDPAYYGIKCKRLLSGMGHLIGMEPAATPSTITGTFLLSATDVTGVHWAPDSQNPYQIFFDREPDARIGNVILVYHGTFDVPLLSALTKDMEVRKLLSQGRNPEAVALAEDAARVAPGSAEVVATLSAALLAAGRTAEGQQARVTALHLAEADHPEFQRSLINTLSAP